MTQNTIWKISNTSNQQIKITVAIASNGAPGIILQPGEYCLSHAQMTTPLDAQHKRGFVSIDMNYENKFNLPLATAFAKDELEIAKEQTEKYAG